MANKSPTFAVKYGETIGTDEFSQRREVFDKHGTIFLPPQSPTIMGPAHEVDPIITSNHGKTTTNFKRNTPMYSSMRETKTADKTVFDFRPRKFSDNFTSDLNQSDDVDYRHTMTERTRRLSKLRRDFLNSNLHDPSESAFARVGMRASMPARSAPIAYSPYKLESPTLYKFPFAEPYTTPTPVRKVVLDLGPVEIDNSENQDLGKENQDPEPRRKYQSLPNDENTSKIDHQKLFEELVKRYSPQRKPIDWTLPPTKPRVVGSVPKSSSSGTGTITDYGNSQDNLHKSRDEVFHSNKDSTSDNTGESGIIIPQESENSYTEDIKVDEEPNQTLPIQNGPTSKENKNPEQNKERDSKISLTELAEKNDEVPELSTVQRQLSKESSPRKSASDIAADLTIPDLIDKMTTEGETLQSKTKDKKVKRKRSFLDRLLGRKKDK